MSFDIICAVDQKYGFGYYDNKTNTYKLPWNNKLDLQFFKNKTSYVENPTKKNAIVMGRNTWNSINKVLPNRLTFVLSHTEINNEEVITINNFDKVFDICNNKIENIFLIGGASIIHSLLNHPKLRYIYLNQIQETYDCNISFKPILHLQNQFKIINKEKVENIIMYKLKNIQFDNELNYLNLLKDIYGNGNKRQTRNSITLSLFGKKLSFNLRDKLPVLTTKKIFFRGLVEELLWFLKGETNSQLLEDKKINIWKGNTSKEFLESVNLDYEEGDIGAMYGFNWLHFGAEYGGFKADYKNKGFDQLKYCMKLLEKDPFSRRIIMTTYDPANADRGVLYPCHGIITQFYINEVDNIRYLSCNMYQRSADMFLGVPFNITSYSLLCYIICEVLNNTTNFTYKPDKLKIYFGDCHIYIDHIESIHKQLEREPYAFPTLEFNKKIKNFNDIKYEDFKLINYLHHETIKAAMIS